MKKETSIIIAAFIIALGLICAAYLYYLSTRYVVDSGYIIDTWEKTYIQLEEVKR